MTLIEASRDQSTRLLDAILRSDLYSFLQQLFRLSHREILCSSIGTSRL
jgi:hypothetical protein